jgi:hypothetical protein
VFEQGCGVHPRIEGEVELVIRVGTVGLSRDAGPRSLLCEVFAVEEDIAANAAACGVTGCLETANRIVSR